jgi:uncharacterized Fe-S cluster-containing radical SAM superfamily protein
MSATERNASVELLVMTAEHLEVAIKNYREAARLYEAGNDQKASHFVLVGSGEAIFAHEHVLQVAKLQAEEFRKSQAESS